MAERETGGMIIEETKAIRATKATKAINGAKGIRETKGMEEIEGIGGEARKEKTAVTMGMTTGEGTSGMATGTPRVGKVAEVINESFYL